MGKKFKEALQETADKASVSKSGKVKKTHSRTEFDKLLKTYLNDVNYETEFVSIKNGEPVKTKVRPVEMVRETMLKKPLMDAGVDAQEAESIAKNYEYSKVDGCYEAMTDFMYEFLANGGKKIDFPTREDFTGSISIEKVDKNRKTYKSIGSDSGETFDVETDDHYILKTKSKAPSWIKKKFAN